MNKEQEIKELKEQLKFKSIDKKPMTFCLGENNAEKLSKFIINDLGYRKESEIATEIYQQLMNNVLADYTETLDKPFVEVPDIKEIFKKYGVEV